MDEKDPRQMPEELEPETLPADSEPGAEAKEDDLIAGSEQIEDEILGADSDYADLPNSGEEAASPAGVAQKVETAAEAGLASESTADNAVEETTTEFSSDEGDLQEEQDSRTIGTGDLSEEVGPKQASHNLNRILDIELPVTVHFGSVRRPLVEVLKLGPGSLLELDRLATEPVVLKVNDKVFARGQVVDVDGYYGVKITEIVSTEERITSLGEYQ